MTWHRVIGQPWVVGIETGSSTHKERKRTDAKNGHSLTQSHIRARSSLSSTVCFLVGEISVFCSNSGSRAPDAIEYALCNARSSDWVSFWAVTSRISLTFLDRKVAPIECAMLEAVESSVHGGSSQSQSCGESSEEELSVLPRHTKVIVTGNNRTKSVLVGLQGVVKKAVGLGGWHWLVLTNGIEVKLQRNALSVIEGPTGNEEDEDLEFENIPWTGSDMASDDTLKSHRSRPRTHKSTSSSHRTMSRSLSCDSHSKASVSVHPGSMKVDLSKLEMAALWRYWRHFNLVGASPNPSKEQLVDVVQRHFMSQQMDELQVIAGFVKAAKRLKTVCQ